MSKALNCSWSHYKKTHIKLYKVVQGFFDKYLVTNVILLNALLYFGFAIMGVMDPALMCENVLKVAQISAPVNDLSLALVRCNCVAFAAITLCGFRALRADMRGKADFLFFVVAFHVFNLLTLVVPPQRMPRDTGVRESTGPEEVEPAFAPLVGDVCFQLVLVILTAVAYLMARPKKAAAKTTVEEWTAARSSALKDAKKTK